VHRTPLELDGAGMLIVKVRLFAKGIGQDFRFILDTGASRSVVDTGMPSSFLRAAPRADPPRVRDSTERSVNLDRVRVARLEIGGQVREDLLVYRMNLKQSFLAAHQDEPVDGILGMDVLRGTRFVIDPQALEVRWGGHLEGTRVPLTFDPHGRPALALKLEGVEVCCYLDTGARSAFRLLGDVKPGQVSTPFTYQGLSGNSQVGKRICVARLEVGDQAWLDAPLELVASGNAGDHLGRASLCAAPLELDLMDRWAVFTAGVDGRLPLLRESDRPEWVWVPTPKGRSLRVESCPSWWTQAGLRVGDELIRLGPGQQLSIRSATAQLGRGETWTLRRDGALVPWRCPAQPEPAALDPRTQP